MKSFQYTIKDELGIHARPAGMLVKEAKTLESKLTITKDEKVVELTKMMALMGLNVRCGDTVTISAEGADEETALEKIQKLFEENL